jgi:hypothetical protein
VVIEEAERNPEFARQIEGAIWNSEPRTQRVRAPEEARTARQPEPRRGAHRRATPAVDPVALARQGEALLREELCRLTLDQLHDIVAGYGMDTGKLVMKWKTPERVRERIVEVSLSRAQKGSAFRSAEPEEPESAE